MRCGASRCHRIDLSTGGLRTLWTGAVPCRRVVMTLRTVTCVDRSRSCPQECAQVGEIVSPSGAGRPEWAPTRGCAAPSFGLSGPDVNPLFDQDISEATAFEPGITPRPARSTWAFPGDGQGVGRGEGVEYRRPLCTAVDPSTCRQQDTRRRPTAGQQGHSAAEQRKGVGSPASTRVMTRMR